MTSVARSRDQDLKTSTASHDNGEGYYARGMTEKKDHVRNNKGKSRSTSGSRITCLLFKKQGHTKRECYAYKKKHGR